MIYKQRHMSALNRIWTGVEKKTGKKGWKIIYLPLESVKKHIDHEQQQKLHIIGEQYKGQEGISNG